MEEHRDSSTSPTYMHTYPTGKSVEFVVVGIGRKISSQRHQFAQNLANMQPLACPYIDPNTSAMRAHVASQSGGMGHFPGWQGRVLFSLRDGMVPSGEIASATTSQEPL